MNVIVADNHSIVRHGLKRLLELEPDINVVGEAHSGNAALELLAENDVDVVVLDIKMPGRSGLETLKDIKRIYPDIHVLILSMHPSDQYAIRVLRAGAVGYINKECAPEELVAALRKVQHGEKYINAEVAELLAEFVQKRRVADPHTLLSDREFEVFCLIGAGKGLTEIGNKMNLSVKTISTYRSRILEKTGFSSNAEITRYTVERGLV
jgi:two-component system, NarL family, invasion response regulator UvrY